MTFSADSRSTDSRSCGSPRGTTIAFTSMCFAMTGAISLRYPVSTLTTPAGRSLVASASAKTTAVRGSNSEASSTTAFPATTGGKSTETRPSNAGRSGAHTTTTPIGSAVEKLKCGPATGLRVESNAAYLSLQPAYQTVRSIAAVTSRSASCSEHSAPSRMRSVSSPRRASIISAKR